MKLTDQELFALTKLFSGDSEIENHVLKNLHQAIATERIDSKVGFFTTIEIVEIPKCLTGPIACDWNFTHEKMPYGGSFIGFIVDRKKIDLEAVTHDGLWPSTFEADLFKDQEFV